MKGKKLIAALIAVAMVLSTMTFTVFAEETETVAAIEDTEFATNSDAAEELTTMTVEEETFDDNLLLTKEGGTVLEEGTDYTVSYGSYYYNGTHQAYKIYNIKSSVTDITISGGVAYSHDWYPTMFFKSNVVIASNTIANIILDDVVLGAIQVGSNSSATFTLVGDNNVSSIAGESTSQLIFEGEGSLTSDHIGGKSVYGSDVGCPAITINSGTYTITPSSSYAAAIGGGQSSSATNGITINGGTITASSSYGAGIGGGQNGKAKNITINGGTITATGSYGAAIGGGASGDAENITINGGTITATGSYGAGIGSGKDADAKNISITGGNIYVGGGAGNGAGIGSGHGGDVDGISITGGTIVVEPRSQTINEKYMGVGIGAGADSAAGKTTANNIVIENADVTVNFKPTNSSMNGKGNAVGTPVGAVAATNVSIKCGTYSSDINAYTANGYYAAQKAEGMYEVVKASATVVDTARSSGVQVTLDDLEKNDAIDPSEEVTYQLVVKSLTVEDRAAVAGAISDPAKTVIAFDFSVQKIVDGMSEEVTVTNQKVTITLPTPVTDRSSVIIYHIKNGAVEGEPIESSDITFSDDNKTISFIAPSFSTYAVEYDASALADADIAKDIEVVLEQVAGKTDEYDLVLKSGVADKYINGLLSADLTFALNSTTPLSYTIEGAANINVIDNGGGRFAFNYDGIGASSATGEAINIGKVKFEGYCENASFTIVDVPENVVNTTKSEDSMVDKYDVDGDGITTGLLNLGSGIPSLTIETVKKNLAIVIDFPNAIADQIADYQDMAVTITGSGITPIVVDLGTDGAAALAGGKYTVNINDTLVKDYTYTVTVSGAGYRTARYNVTMTGDKVLNFWNNVKDSTTNVEEGNNASAKKVTFLAGDIVKDNNINLYDLSAVVSYFGMIDLSSDPSKYKYAKYDLNRDGKIDSKDVAYVLVSWDN